MPVPYPSCRFLTRSRTRFFLTAAASAITALPCVAQAQMVPVPAPPVEQSVDGNGVDVVFGTFNISSTDLAIGPAGAQGMVYARESRGAGWRDNLAATISSSGTAVMVSVGGSSDSFTQSGSSFTSTQGNGATLVLAGDYVYTSADGTVVRFAPASGDYDRFVSNMGWARSIEFANGARWDFTYADKLYCPQTLAGGQTCTVPLKRSVRLQSVTNSFRYQLKLEYGSNILTHMGELERWNRVARVTGINNAVEACAPAADSCPLTNPWPYVTYDASGETVTHSGGTVKRFTKGANGITAIKRPGAATDNVIISYGADGKVASVVDESVASTYNWNDTGSVRTLTVTGPLASSRTVVSNLSTGLVSASVDALGRSTGYLYDPQTRLTRVTSPEGNYTQYSYDARGNVMTTTNVAKPGSALTNIVTTATYPATCTNPKICNKPVTTTDALARVTNYEYDPGHGGITVITAPAAVAGGVRPQTRYGYTSLNGVALLTSTSTCQTLGSCAGTADELKTVISYGAATSNMLPVAASTGSGDGTLTATVAASYDIFGNRTSVDGPLPGAADTVRTRYDGLRRVVGVIAPDPDGAGALKHRAQRVTYNADSQPLLVETGTVAGTTDSDWAGFVSLQQASSLYDTAARLVRESVTAAGVTYGVTHYSYDALGRLDCTAQRLNPAQWASLPASACTAQTAGSAGPDRISKTLYNEVGQATQLQTALGTPVQANIIQSYSANGNVETLIDGKGNKTTYAYDGFDRLVKTSFPSPTMAGTSSTTDYEAVLLYDDNGNVGQRRLRDGQIIAYTYDNLDRLTLKDVPNVAPYEYDISYAYDLLGRLKLIQDSGTHYAAITYDVLGRQLSETGNFSTRFFTYDVSGRRTSLSYGDGFYTSYDYLVTGEMLAIRDPDGALLAGFAYDDLGRRTSLTRGNGTVTTYAYDPASRLTNLAHDFAGSAQDVTATFSYNAASQIASRTRSNDLYAWTGAATLNRPYTSNGLNQHVTSGGAALGYDGRGNLTASGADAYSYTSENRLASGPNATLFAHDPFGRLYFPVVGASGPVFQYDGAQLIREQNPAGYTFARHIFGPAGDEPILSYVANGSGGYDKRYAHADERGSIIATSNASGTVTQINAYDDYGIPQGKSATGALIAGGTATAMFGRFGYTGQAWLPEVGLYHYKNRTYSPTMGRFMQADPIGYGDGVNLYAYVGGDPINFTDPLGLAAENDDISQDTIIVNGRKESNGIGGGRSIGAGFSSGDRSRSDTSGLIGTIVPDAPSQGMCDTACQAIAPIVVTAKPTIAGTANAKSKGRGSGNRASGDDPVFGMSLADIENELNSLKKGKLTKEQIKRRNLLNTAKKFRGGQQIAKRLERFRKGGALRSSLPGLMVCLATTFCDDFEDLFYPSSEY